MNIKPIALFVGATISSQALALDEPIVITATRTAQTVDQSLASVTIITSEDIKASQAKSIQELISGHVGIDTTNRGGYGKSSSLFIRGTNTGHVLVLVDGLQIGSATLGQTELQYLPLAQIERIEIVRGPRSSLYGSEAIGGVIQIFTRQGQSGQQVHLDFGVGSHNLRQGTLSASGGHNNTRHNVTVSGLSDDGFDSIDDGEDDDDGYKNQSASLRLGHTFANGLDIDGHLMTAQGESDFDGAFQNGAEFAQQNYGLTLAYPLSDRWYSKLAMGSSKDESDSLLNGVHSSEFITKRQQISWQNDIKLSTNHDLNLGIDQQTDKVESDIADYDVSELDNLGVFAQLHGDIDAHNYAISLRNDDNEAFGNEMTGSFAWGVTLPSKTHLSGSYGTAFKTPSFNDLYYPFSGNPDLKPEKSNSIEIRLAQEFETSRIEFSIYQTEIEDLIEWACSVNCADPDWNNHIWKPSNVAEAKIHGAELRYTTQLLGWNSSAELSWIDPRDKVSDNVLQLRAQKSARLDFMRDFGKTSVNVSAIAQGSRYTDAFNSAELGGYGIVNIAGAYALNKRVTLNARIQNLGDKQYQTVANYNSAGRTFFVGVAYDIAR